MTATVTGTLTDPSGTAIEGVPIVAVLVAASEVLTGGSAIIRQEETTTDTSGAWSLTLTSLADLAVGTGAYYALLADGHRWTIEVPDDLAYTLDEVLVEPGPLPSTGATTAALATKPSVRYWDGDSYELASGAIIYVGGPTDPTVNNGDIWIDTDN